MKLLQTLLALLLVCESSATEAPIATSVGAQPFRVKAGQMVTILIAANNRSKQRQLWPHNLKVDGIWKINEAGIGFGKSSDDIPAFSYLSISSTPPVFLWIEPSEKKQLQFSWTADSKDVGQGFLFVKLPPGFEALKPIPITILPKNTEQSGADQPATAPESKPEGKVNPKPESEAAPR